VVPGELLPLEPVPNLVASLQCAMATLRWMRPKLHEGAAAKLERSALQLVVAHAIEALLTGPKAKHSLAGTGQNGLDAMRQLADTFDGVDEARAAEAVEPLRALLTLATCPPSEFADRFGALRLLHAEMSSAVAKSVLARRQGVSKAEQKALLGEVLAGADEELSAAVGESAELDQPPVPIKARWGTPFGLAVARLERSAASS
jgi:hypothetical protein